jgi:hypothetical protein
LKREAQDAGVTSAGEPDYRAANMVALLDKREVYDLIAGDLGQFFAAGDAVVPTWAASSGAKTAEAAKGADAKPADGAKPAEAPLTGPAFNLDKFNTEYLPPIAPSSDSLGSAPPRGGGMEGGDEPPKISAFPRIKCELVVTTSQPEPRRLVEKTISKWLEANKKRSGIPYVLAFNEPAFKVTEVGRDPNAPAQPVLGMGDAGGSAPGAGRGAAAGAPRSRVNPVMERPPAPEPTIRYFGGNVPPPSQQESVNQEASAALAKLDTMAPLIEPPEGRVPTTATVRVTWYVVFMPPEPAEGAPSGGNK